MLLADQGEEADALQAIRATRAAVTTSYGVGVDQMRTYLDGAGPFPARAHLVTLLARFYADFAEAVLDWCDTAETEISGWPDVRDVGLTEDTRRELEVMIDRYDRRIAAATARPPALDEGPPR